MTAKITRYLAERRPDNPLLVVDLDVVANNYRSLRRFLPIADVFYAVKANPAAEILKLLAGLGSNFDTASRGEIEMVMAAGASADRISFGNTSRNSATSPGPSSRASVCSLLTLRRS